MKRTLSLVLILILLVTTALPASATGIQANGETLISTRTIDLGNGLIAVEETSVLNSNLRTTDKTFTRRNTFYDSSDTMIAVIAVTAVFRYDGSTVRVVSKTVSQSDTYDGWSFSLNSLTSSGGTVTMSGKLTKLLILNQPITVSITCDKNGNIT